MVSTDGASWISTEFEQIKLGDSRLDKRLELLSNSLLDNPGSPIHQACGTWGKAKAAYRLLDNRKLKSSVLMRAHQGKTVERMQIKESGLCFAIQDTTELDYTHHPRKKGMGTLSRNTSYNSSRKGFLIHSTLIVNSQAVPLGLIDQKIYKRTQAQKNNKQRPISEKESYRWIESLRNTKERDTTEQCVTICDREADIFEFLLEAKKLKSHVLVRASKNRLLVKTQKNQAATLRPFMQTVSLATRTHVDIPAKSAQKARTAELEVRYEKVVLKPPQRTPSAKDETLIPIEMNVVWMHESNPPKGCDGLDWMLLTTLEVRNTDEALKIGQYYRLRWQIECYHRILKSGCRIESSRLGDYERLHKFVTMQSVVAIRLFFLTHIARTHPDQSCENVFSSLEWAALDCYINQRSIPRKDPPTCREVVRMIASLGGFLGRKGDGEPGMTYIWRGWDRLEVIVKMRQCLVGI